VTDRQRKKPRRLHDSDDYSISDLVELFSVSRPTVYRPSTVRPAERWRIRLEVAAHASRPPPGQCHIAPIISAI